MSFWSELQAIILDLFARWDFLLGYSCFITDISDSTVRTLLELLELLSSFRALNVDTATSFHSMMISSDLRDVSLRFDRLPNPAYGPSTRPVQCRGTAGSAANNQAGRGRWWEKVRNLDHCSTTTICTRRDIDSLSEEYTSGCS